MNESPGIELEWAHKTENSPYRVLERRVDPFSRALAAIYEVGNPSRFDIGHPHARGPLLTFKDLVNASDDPAKVRRAVLSGVQRALAIDVQYMRPNSQYPALGDYMNVLKINDAFGQTYASFIKELDRTLVLGQQEDDPFEVQRLLKTHSRVEYSHHGAQQRLSDFFNRKPKFNRQYAQFSTDTWSTLQGQLNSSRFPMPDGHRLVVDLGSDLYVGMEKARYERFQDGGFWTRRLTMPLPPAPTTLRQFVEAFPPQGIHSISQIFCLGNGLNYSTLVS